LLSNKSNEELNVEHQYRQIQRQRQRPSYFPAHLPHATRSGGSLIIQQQQQPQHRHFYESTAQQLHNSSNSNNLNNSASSRDWREDARDDEDMEEDDNNDSAIFGVGGGSTGRRRNRRRQLPTQRDEEGAVQQLAAGSSNLLNMNVNSPLYQRNKVPAKPTTSAVSLTPLQQRHLRFDFDLTSQYLDYESPVPTALQAPLSAPVYNVTTRDSAAGADETNATMDQTEDTASEELNRNLLVNALKNDKFTTKFYESIKEDVYRRLETLFEQQQQQQEDEIIFGFVAF